MKIKTASTILLISSVAWLAMMVYHEWYRYGYLDQDPDFRYVGHAVPRFLSGFLFLGAALSFRKNPGSTGNHKLLGMLLVLCGASMIGMEIYEMIAIDSGIHDLWSKIDHWLSRSYMLLLAFSFMGFGIGLSGSNRRNFRWSLLLLMAGSVGRMILGGYILFRSLSYVGLNTTSVPALVMDLLEIARYVFPLAILLFAWTLYRKKDLSGTPLDDLADQ
jgi:hypothetical protein